ncbi:MAG TPA: diadenylate cyclase [Planctomycetia bacterium]|nr:diadenylate cyclase [Planctomycetia bacterium]
MNKLTDVVLRHAQQVAKELRAKALVCDADLLEEDDRVSQILEDLAETETHLVLMTPDKELAHVPVGERLHVLKLPPVALTRLSQIKMAVVMGVAEQIFERADVIVTLCGVQNSGKLDLMAVLKVGDEPEFFATDELNPLPPDVQPAVFEKLLMLASELAAEGREMRPVGAILVVGDAERVLENSRQLVFNPFKGYSEEERNVLTGELDETIKEFAAIDGAFIFRGDGVILSAGRYLMPKGKPAEALRSGLGARHEAAAAITAVTDAVAISLSQSTGTLTIYNSGRAMTEIERARGKAPGDAD